MKKSLIALLVFTILISNMSIVFAKEEVNKLKYHEKKEIQEKAIRENKVLTKEKFDELNLELQETRDISSLEEYAVEREYYYPNDNSLSSNDIILFSRASNYEEGDTRITKDTYYQYEGKMDDSYRCSDGNEMSEDVVIGFASFLPSPFGPAFGALSIFKAVASSSVITSSEDIYIKSTYDALIKVKYAEIYSEKYGWRACAKTEYRQCDGYYVVSWYDGDDHDSDTVELGTLREDTGKYYSHDDNDENDEMLLSFCSPGTPYVRIFDYLSGSSEYYQPVLEP